MRVSDVNQSGNLSLTRTGKANRDLGIDDAARDSGGRDIFPLINVLLMVLVPIAFWLHSWHSFNHDISWFYYVARGVMRGGRLYVDFIEPNAPLASLSLVPAVWICDLTGLSPAQSIILYGLVIATGITLFCHALFQRFGLGKAITLAFSTLVFCEIAIFPFYGFAQREQIIAMLMLPYSFVVALRCANLSLPRSQVLLSGLLAGLAVAVKPPYALVIVAAEAVLLCHLSWRRSIRLESVTVAILVVASSALTILAFPLYAERILPWTVDLYAAYGQADTVIVRATIVGILIVVIGLIRQSDSSKRLRPLRYVLISEALACLFIYILQFKGWRYQLVPALTFASIGGLTLFADIALLKMRGASRNWREFALVGVLAFLFSESFEEGTQAASLESKVRPEVAAVEGSFLVLSTGVFPGFPTAVDAGKVWASRYPCLIMLPGIVQAELRHEPSRWEAPFRASIVEDFERYQPKLVLVHDAPEQAMPRDFRPLDWLRRDPAFERVWQHYRAEKTIDGYVVYRRD